MTYSKTLALDTIDDLVIDFLHYDRDDDEELTYEVLEELITSNGLTIEEMVKRFREKLTECLEN